MNKTYEFLKEQNRVSNIWGQVGYWSGGDLYVYQSE